MISCVAFAGTGVALRERVLDLVFALSGDVSGTGGAKDPLLPDLDLILSISTLKNGSGSSGSITSLSSARLGL